MQTHKTVGARILSPALSFAMFCTTFPATAFATDPPMAAEIAWDSGTPTQYATLQDAFDAVRDSGTNTATVKVIDNINLGATGISIKCIQQYRAVNWWIWRHNLQQQYRRSQCVRRYCGDNQ